MGSSGQVAMITTKDNSLTFVQDHGGVYCLLVSPPVVVEKVLELAQLTPGKILYDLGSGDGRILIEAVRQCGARAVGVESNPELCEHSRKRVRDLGLQKDIRIREENLYECDISNANVVVVYLGPEDMTETLVSRLAEDLKHHGKIITITTGIPGWTPARLEKVTDGTNVYPIYLYHSGDIP